MLKKLALSAVLLASTALSGCFTTTLSAADADYPISLSAKPSAAYVRSFKVEIKSHHFVLGLAHFMGEPAVKAAIDAEVKRSGGRAVNNLKISTQFGFLDFVLGGLTSGLYMPSTVIIEGDIIK